MFDFIRQHQLNIMLLLCGASGILTLLLFITRFLNKRRKWALILMELVAMFLLWFDRLAYCYAGNLGHKAFVMVRVSNFFVFFLTPAVVLGFNEGAYMAETIRGALDSVSRGQVEAGYCVGLNFPKIMGHIVLPQAMRTAFPALSNSMISMLKETSMAATITVMEVFRQAQVINGRVYESLGLYGEVALIYLLFCTILTWIQRRSEKRLASYGGVRT